MLVCTLHCGANYAVKKANFSREKAVYLVEPVLLSALLKMNNEKEQFDANVYVGEVFFSGPLETESNGIVHSKLRRFTNQAEYSDRIFKEVKLTLAEAVSNLQPQKEILSGDSLPLTVDRSQPRDKNAEDGTDNLNLPRIHYDLRWDRNRTTQLKPGYYVVPVIEYYYGHTGGWFNGQNFGCGAGARISISVQIFDAEDGKTVFQFSDFRRQVGEYQFRSNSVQMSQDLAQLEKGILSDIRRELRSL